MNNHPKNKQFLVTAALPYSNGSLHVGHVGGAYLPADIFVRYQRQNQRPTRFICGSDDHGVAALISAKKEGQSVEDLTAHYHHLQAEDFKALGIHFDIYGGTHHPEFAELHKQFAQDFFRVIHDRGYFLKKTSQQLYDPEVKQFLPDRFVKGTCYLKLPNGEACDYPEAYGDQCESCGGSIDPLQLINPVSTLSQATPEVRDTTHWYLQLQKFEQDLQTWLESKGSPADGIAWRDTVLNFVRGQIKQGLPERAMTRDLDWGVPLPLDDPDAAGKALYVWFDAPIGYVSFTAQLLAHEGGADETLDQWWKNPDCDIIHFIGEDNTVFHAITWPAMLMAEGSYQLPAHVVANSYINERGDGGEILKMSKSRMGSDSLLWINKFLENFDPDPLRYYLTSIAPESQRGAFDLKEFITRNNSELLNSLGNFVNRTMTFAHKYFDGQVPERGALQPADEALFETIKKQQTLIADHIEHFRFKAALQELMALAREANAYFDSCQPWKLRKTDLEACGHSIHCCLQMIRALTVLMNPFMPFSAEKCRQMLNLQLEDLNWDQALEPLKGGQPLGEAVMLFKKLDDLD